MQLGRYQNYKGNFYEVVGIALDAVAQQKVVIYKALYPVPTLEAEYGAQPAFTRPYDAFFADIEYEGKVTPRFWYVGDA